MFRHNQKLFKIFHNKKFFLNLDKFIQFLIFFYLLFLDKFIQFLIFFIYYFGHLIKIIYYKNN